MTQSRLLDRLIKESFQQREIHPYLKRMVLAATQSALRQVSPDKYINKCQGAAAAIFMLLRSLRIRSTICGGTVSWLYGGIDQNGMAWESRCGFWSNNPELPTPHAWVVTEFGGLVDLTCSYFHHVFDAQRKGLRSHDVLPMIWMKSENLNALPSVQYNVTAQYDQIDLASCDKGARQVVGTALSYFWGQQWIESEVQSDAEVEKIISTIPIPPLENSVLEGPRSLEQLRQVNGWVARNSAMPSGMTLAMSPTV